MADINFDGRVALITGAGSGLGRAYALELARRGARVVVNDLPPAAGDLDGATAVAGEIQALGHEAVASHASVSDPAAVQAMIDEIARRWGRLDIVVANAGMVRDRTLAKMTVEDFNAVVAVNLLGGFLPVKAAWELMRAQNFGRIVLTTLAAGLYGNFGQANYAAAKLGLVGLMNSLRLEGEKYGIRVNAIAPGAATSMTAGLVPQEQIEHMSPARVAPGVAYLCSDEAPTGTVLSAVAGGFAVVRLVETEGLYLGSQVAAEDVRDRWAEISARTGDRPFGVAAESSSRWMGAREPT